MLIPELSYKTGSTWSQPEAKNIKFTGVDAIISKEDFELLTEVPKNRIVPDRFRHPGVMWKTNPYDDVWKIHWLYAPEDNPIFYEELLEDSRTIILKELVDLLSSNYQQEP